MNDWVDYYYYLQAYLRGTELGSTVPQVEALIKRHDAFENLLASQDAKVSCITDADSSFGLFFLE